MIRCRLPLEAIVATAELKTEYQHAVETLAQAGLAIDKDAELGDEEFVPRPDGGGWIIVRVAVKGTHVADLVHPASPGEWRWVLSGKGGSA